MSYKEVISTENADWETEAEQLARQRQPFVLVGWRLSFDHDFCTELAGRHTYRYRFDPEKDRAFFDPSVV